MPTQRRIESIVFLERNTFNISFRKPDFEHEWVEYAATAESEVVERLRDATIAICNKVALGKEALSKLPQLKLIAVAATGTDNVNLAYCRTHNIAVCNTRGYAVSSLPEHALMLMFALRRNLISYRDDVRDGRWQEAKQFCLLDHSISDLRGTVLGIIGFGTLGKAMAELARGIGMDVIVAERKQATSIRPGRRSFADVLQLSDVLSLHCPLTEETRDLIGAAELKQMKQDALLINSARGGLVDDRALLEALTSGKLGGAGIDVLRVEPPREGNPLLEADLPNLIVTPHNAWASKQAMQTLADQLVDNLEAFVRGEPRNLVT
ncbi:MAG TPA: D-2-hydroxyacid dehydrogenase [Pyrinomonadaceae bacterium]|nr:D-2-hydroxyacid dehydrogenase [Pyrinomonadaceae bacterium]